MRIKSSALNQFKISVTEHNSEFSFYKTAAAQARSEPTQSALPSNWLSRTSTLCYSTTVNMPASDDMRQLVASPDIPGDEGLLPHSRLKH